MSRKGRSAGAEQCAQENAKDMAKADKRRKLEKERADAQRKKTVVLFRSGKLKLKKAKPLIGILAPFSSPAHQPAIRRNDVMTDEPSTFKKSTPYIPAGGRHRLGMSAGYHPPHCS